VTKIPEIALALSEIADNLKALQLMNNHLFEVFILSSKTKYSQNKETMRKQQNKLEQLTNCMKITEYLL